MTRHPDVLTADEAAAFLGLSRKSVYDGAGRGEIPHRRVGRRIIFHRPTLEDWLRASVASQGRGASGG